VLQSEDFMTALAAAGALYLPVMLAFWFAPPLAAWHSTGAAKALFFSFAASMMNWRAFLAYGAVMSVVTLLVPFLIVSAFALAGALAPPAAALIFPLAIVLLPTLFASFYASYRDVFGYDPRHEASELSEGASPEFTTLKAASAGSSTCRCRTSAPRSASSRRSSANSTVFLPPPRSALR